jgi:hypothetical protein
MDTQVKERKMAQRRVRTEAGPVVNPDGVADTVAGSTRQYPSAPPAPNPTTRLSIDTPIYIWH